MIARAVASPPRRGAVRPEPGADARGFGSGSGARTDRPAPQTRAGPCSALAVPAPDRGALADAGLLERPAAARAGLAAAAIGRQLLLEIARRAVRADEVAQGGAAALDGVGQDVLDRGCERGVALARDLAGR